MGGTALARSFMTYQAALLRYLRARGAGEEAEDLLQELWIKAQAGDDGAVADARAYLYRMAHNLMLDRRRADQRRHLREDHYRTDIRGHSGDVDDTPAADRVLIARERLRSIDQLLASLGQRTDHIFRRHRVDEVTQREIADELGITLSAVEKHLQKAYKAIAASRLRLSAREDQE